MIRRVAAYAAGRVQGVGYRYHVAACARAAGVCGTVRNLPDGTVEIVAEGEEMALKDFLAQCRAEGNPYIRVDRLDPIWEEGCGTFRAFTILQ